MNHLHERPQNIFNKFKLIAGLGLLTITVIASANNHYMSAKEKALTGMAFGSTAIGLVLYSADKALQAREDKAALLHNLTLR
jgi:hypothetical protein